METRIYDNVFTAVSNGVVVGSAVQDFMPVLVPTGKSIDILEVIVSQKTEEGDAAAEMLAVTLRTFTGPSSWKRASRRRRFRSGMRWWTWSPRLRRFVGR